METKKRKPRAKSAAAAPSINWHVTPYAGKTNLLSEEVAVRSMSTAESSKGLSYDGFFLQGVQFGWCTRGRLRLHLSDAEPIDVRKGQFAIIYGQRIVGVEALEDHTVDTNVILSGLGAMNFADELGLYDGFVTRDEMPASTIHMLNEMVNRRKTDSSVSNAVILNTVSNMLTSVVDHARMMGKAQFLSAVKCFDDHFLQNDFSVNSVAYDLNISPNTLYLLFRSHGFESPGAFAEARQLRRAHAMLANSRVKIGEIARCCGFSSPAHFSVFIRKHFDHTPRELRNSTRNDIFAPAESRVSASKSPSPS